MAGSRFATFSPSLGSLSTTSVLGCHYSLLFTALSFSSGVVFGGAPVWFSVVALRLFWSIGFSVRIGCSLLALRMWCLLPTSVSLGHPGLAAFVLPFADDRYLESVPCACVRWLDVAFGSCAMGMGDMPPMWHAYAALPPGFLPGWTARARSFRSDYCAVLLLVIAEFWGGLLNIARATPARCVWFCIR